MCSLWLQVMASVVTGRLAFIGIHDCQHDRAGTSQGACLHGKPFCTSYSLISNKHLFPLGTARTLCGQLTCFAHHSFLQFAVFNFRRM
ncbi:hypothetical protein DUNSADRAFT_14216 [Dunaliella salina]|uniref:Secreted protein n=1 Tax=Dunaliella salina TaxID=3046 RepID=A0ABQ7G7R8_DUNSA|nr:hypothetical protein DUNSADRAFT_14216 [Dunaliella salina]|eukprot:KAF5830651.1 hypothetical protein DUNSADRAFT_14216 [Dunaliella salina]